MWEHLPPELAKLLIEAESPPPVGQRQKWGTELYEKLRPWALNFDDEVSDAMNFVAGAMVEGAEPKKAVEDAYAGAVNQGLQRMPAGAGGPVPSTPKPVKENVEKTLAAAATPPLPPKPPSGGGAGFPHGAGGGEPPKGGAGGWDGTPGKGPASLSNVFGGYLDPATNTIAPEPREPIPGKPVGGNDGEAVRVLQDIRTILGRLLEQAAKGGGGPRQPGQEDRQGGFLRHAAAQFWGQTGLRTRAGRVATQAWRAIPAGTRKAIGKRVGKWFSAPAQSIAKKAAGKVPWGAVASRVTTAGLTTGSGAAAGSGGAAAAAGGAMAAAGPVGIVAGVAVAAAAGITALGVAAKDAAYQQSEHNRKLAEFSPSQAATALGLDVTRTLRTIERGEDTSGSAQKLADAIDKFEEAMLPLEKLVDTMSNTLGATAMDVLTGFVESVNKFVETMRVLNPLVDAAIKAMEAKNTGDGGLTMLDSFAEFDRLESRRLGAGAERLKAAREAHASQRKS